MLPIIEVKNVSKEYKLLHEKKSYVTLRDKMVDVVRHPFRARLKIEKFAALNDVSFSINKGEIVGVIGRNGAGKSTLLKILTGITRPTKGSVHMRGRVSSLLEVGTGFHPELTGRENIFLNGVILGMKKQEIVKKFDQIVEFAGIEQFLDTPVKHYSSGMYVRLAFSVAAHLDPDILIVDEVLAVGDAEFQKKCLGKMEEVSQQQGRTVIFVSHDLDVIQNIAEKVLLFEKGKCVKIGEPNDVISYYVKSTTSSEGSHLSADKSKDACITSVKILDSAQNSSLAIPISQKFSMQIVFAVNKRIDRALVCVIFYHESKIIFVASEGDNDGQLRSYEPGNFKTTIHFPAFLFNVGLYNFDVTIQRPGVDYYDNQQGFNLRIINVDNPRSDLFGGKVYGAMGAVVPVVTEKL